MSSGIVESGAFIDCNGSHKGGGVLGTRLVQVSGGEIGAENTCTRIVYTGAMATSVGVTGQPRCCQDRPSRLSRVLKRPDVSQTATTASK